MRAVVFDMDGVLIDSEPLWREVEVEVFNALGVPIRSEDCEQTMGLRIDEAVAYWHQRHPFERSIEQVAEDIVTGVAAAIRDRGSPLPGAMNALRAVQHSGLADAIATSSPRGIIEAVCDRLPLSMHPSFIFSAADEVAGKPDPAVYLSAARGLGIVPADCLAIEDSGAGVASAKAAGMPVVAIHPLAGADHHVPMKKLAAWLQANWLYGDPR